MNENNLNNQSNNKNEERLNFIRKRVAKEITRNPEESYITEVDTYITNMKDILDHNKAIFKSLTYSKGIGMVNLKDYIGSGSGSGGKITQFKFPLKFNKEDYSSGSDSTAASSKAVVIHQNPALEGHKQRVNSIIDEIRVSSSGSSGSNKLSCLFSCCRKAKQKVIDIIQIKPHNDDIIINNRIKNTPIIQHLKNHSNNNIIDLSSNFVSKIGEDQSKLGLLRLKQPGEKLKVLHSNKELGGGTKEIDCSPNSLQVYKHSKCKISINLFRDIAKVINMQNKQGCKAVMHQHTFSNNNYSIVKDYFFLCEYYLRTNFDNLLKDCGKQAKHPLVTNGNIYVQNLIYIRHSGMRNYDLLNQPILTSVIMSQLLEVDEHAKEFNKIIIEQNIEFTDILGYDSIIVNLHGLNNENFIIELIEVYLQIFSNNSKIKFRNITFAIDCSYEAFIHVYKVCKIESLLNQYSLKLDIVQEDEHIEHF
jgi:hypothetical protein